MHRQEKEAGIDRAGTARTRQAPPRVHTGRPWLRRHRVTHHSSSIRSPTSSSTALTTSHRRLRDHAPVYFNEQYEFWALFRYDDIRRAHKDWQTFSSAHRVDLSTLHTDPEIINCTMPSDLRPRRPYGEGKRQQAARYPLIAYTLRLKILAAFPRTMASTSASGTPANCFATHSWECGKEPSRCG